MTSSSRATSIGDNLRDAVGETPLIYLNRLPAQCGVPDGTRIAVKLEYMNPTCSIKDRAARGMVAAVEARDRSVRPGRDIFIEVTSGNTGIALAAVCAQKGYKCIIIQSDTASMERRAAMVAYGAHVIICDSKVDTMDSMIARAKRLQSAIGKYRCHLLEQFANPENVVDHYETTGPEIWRQTRGQVDAVCFGVGSAGTVLGVSKYLKEQNKGVYVAAVEPAEKRDVQRAFFADTMPPAHTPTTHFIQGIGAGLIPGVMQAEADAGTFHGLIDEPIPVRSECALATSRMLAKMEGLMAGVSSGANVYAAMTLARRPEFRDKLIVTALPSFGDRYFSTALYEELMDKCRAIPVTDEQEDVDKFTKIFSPPEYELHPEADGARDPDFDDMLDGLNGR